MRCVARLKITWDEENKQQPQFWFHVEWKISNHLINFLGIWTVTLCAYFCFWHTETHWISVCTYARQMHTIFVSICGYNFLFDHTQTQMVPLLVDLGTAPSLNTSFFHCYWHCDTRHCRYTRKCRSYATSASLVQRQISTGDLDWADSQTDAHMHTTYTLLCMIAQPVSNMDNENSRSVSVSWGLSADCPQCLRTDSVPLICCDWSHPGGNYYHCANEFIRKGKWSGHVHEHSSLTLCLCFCLSVSYIVQRMALSISLRDRDSLENI